MTSSGPRLSPDEKVLGLWILSPEGRHLGTIVTPEHVHNMAWGDDDGRTLFLAARSGLYRMRLNVPGTTPRAPSH